MTPLLHRRSAHGAALVEYGLLAGLVAVASITAISGVGRDVGEIFLDATSELSVVEEASKGSGNAEGMASEQAYAAGEPTVAPPFDASPTDTSSTSWTDVHLSRGLYTATGGSDDLRIVPKDSDYVWIDPKGGDDTVYFDGWNAANAEFSFAEHINNGSLSMRRDSQNTNPGVYFSDFNSYQVQTLVFEDGTITYGADFLRFLSDQNFVNQSYTYDFENISHEWHYFASYGDRTIYDAHESAGPDVLIMEDLVASDFTVTRYMNDARLTHAGGQIFLHNQNATNFGVEEIRFADGETWSWADIKAMLN